MGDWAALLTAIAATVTAIGGVVVGLVQALRTSGRERERAALTAIDASQNQRIEQLEAHLDPELRARLFELLRQAEDQEARRADDEWGPA